MLGANADVRAEPGLSPLLPPPAHPLNPPPPSSSAVLFVYCVNGSLVAVAVTIARAAVKSFGATATSARKHLSSSLSLRLRFGFKKPL